MKDTDILDQDDELQSIHAQLEVSTGLARAQLLVRLSKCLQESDADRAIALAQEAVAVAIACEDEPSRTGVLAEANLSAANRHLNRYQFLEALEPARSALAFYGELDDVKGVGEASCSLGQTLTGLGKPNEAEEVLSRALDKETSKSATSELALRLFLRRARAHVRLGAADRVSADAERALSLARENRDRRSEVAAHRLIADSHWIRGDAFKVVECVDRMIPLSRELNDRGLEGEGLALRGLALSDLGDYPSALAALGRALAIYRALGRDQNCADQLGNMAVCYARIGDYEVGIPLVEEAIKIFRERGAATNEASALRIASHLYEGAEDLPTAALRARRSLELAVESEMEMVEAGARARLGEVLISSGELLGAEDQLEQALRLARKLGSAAVEDVSLLGRARIQLERKEYRPCLETLDEALPAIERHGNPQLLADLHEIAVSANEGAGDFEAAFHHHKALLEIRETIHGAASRQRVDLLRVNHEVDQKQAELESTLAALQDAKNHLTSVLESLPRGVLVLALSGEVLSVNQNWLSRSDDLFRSADSEIAVGVDYLALLCSEENVRSERLAKLCAGIRSVLSGSTETFDMEYATLSSNETSWTQIHVDPLRDGTPGAIITRSDISAQRRVEEELREHRRRLTRLNRVTAAGELTASIAHELNQPLTAVLSNAQAAIRLLRAADSNVEEVGDALEDIVADNKRAASVIRKLRRLLSDKPVQTESVDVNELISTVEQLYRSDLINRHIETSIELTPDLPQVMADPVQLQQVLINVIVNALEALSGCDARNRKLLVRTFQNEDGGVEIQIEDNGPGVTEEVFDRLFDLFFTTKSGGMGVGLKIARSILEAHQGRIFAERVESGGMRFRIQFVAV